MRNRSVRATLAGITLLSALSPLLLAQLPTWPTLSTLSPCRAGLTGRVVVIKDGVTSSDCSVGGATGIDAHAVTCICDQDGAGGYIWRPMGSGGGGGGGSVESVSGSTPITSTGGTDPVVGCIAATTSLRGCSELATSAETTAGLVVQASDTRLSDSRAPSGSAGGDLAGTYPSPTIAANAVALGTDTTGGYAASSTEAGAATSVAASAVDSTAIADGAIQNADINASAAIALTKLATATSSRCARFDGSGVLVAATGDCTDGDTGGSIPDPLTVSTVQGGTASGGNLILGSTSDSTKGLVCLEGCSSTTVALKAVTVGGTPFVRVVRGDFGAGAGWIANMLAVPNDTTPSALLDDNMVALSTSGLVRWTDNAAANVGSADIQITHPAAGTIALSGYMTWAGECFVGADATNATATLASTGCSMPVLSGRKYTFQCELFVSDSTAAEGVKVDFGGGSATSTNFRAHVTGNDTALAISTQVTSLTGTTSADTFTDDGLIEMRDGFEPSDSGTLIPRFAQNTHVVGTLTLYRGSHCRMWETP